MMNYPIQPKQSALSKAVQKHAAQTIPAPQQDEIARKAYEIYLKRGSRPGNQEQDWLQAELELRARAGASGREETGSAKKKAKIGVAHAEETAPATGTPVARDYAAGKRGTIPMSPGPRNEVK